MNADTKKVDAAVSRWKLPFCSRKRDISAVSMIATLLSVEEETLRHILQRAITICVVCISFPVDGWAQAPNCALSVTMQESTSQSRNVPARITMANCSATVTLQSSNTTLASVTGSPVAAPRDKTVVSNITAGSVNQCQAANITFTASASDGAVVGQVVKQLMVCPYEFDPQISAVSIGQALAGQDSSVNLAIRNQGAQTLFANQLGLGLRTVENMTGLVRNSCGAPVGNSVGAVDVRFPTEIRAGQEGNASARFRFAQAGGLTLEAQVSMSGGEDGPSTNNLLTQTATVPLPRPLVCEILPVSGQANTFTIRGNWFRRFGTTEVPTVTFGSGTAATGVQVISPLELRAQFPGYSCLSGSPNITVANATGGTTASGPSLPGAPVISGTEVNELAGNAFNLVIRLDNFRPACSYTVTLAPVVMRGKPLAVGGTVTPQIIDSGADHVTVRLYHPSVIERRILKVATSYGTATRSITIGPEPKLPKNIRPLAP